MIKTLSFGLNIPTVLGYKKVDLANSFKQNF